VVSGLSVRYGGHLALQNVDLSVRAGELHGLIGANGAGKTTAMDAICGVVPHGGAVVLEGRDLAGLPAHRRAGYGLGRTWQGVELFEDLSVRQNLEVARRTRSAPDPDDVLDRVGLGDRGSDRPAELSLGQQKLVGVARALVGEPKVLLLDEPAAGLDQNESEQFGVALRSAMDRFALSVLLVDHDTRLVFGICDRVTVLDFGAVIASGTAAEVRVHDAVRAAYLGSTVTR
jgi:ABC-type branched-subunit amino acid transport system ATPase component